jgi:hypothetical protein
MKVAAAKKMGRPVIRLDWRKVEKLCEIHCTQVEIANVMGCSVDTLAHRIKKHFGITFPEYFDQKSARGRISLRRRQFTAAMKGNISMLIWLGKNLLNQRDRVEQINVNDPLEELVQEFRRRGDALALTPSDEDPIKPGERPPGTIN